MALPKPVPGLVIRYRYLWHEEQRQGRIDGQKDRPCAIVVTTMASDNETVALVLPITHTPPRDPEDALEIPPITKQRLGLDDDRSWIVLTELNRFVWPGPDMVPLGGEPKRYDYGMLPPALFQRIKQRLLALALAQQKRTRTVTREP